MTTSSGTFIKTLWKQGPSSFTKRHWDDHCNVWYRTKTNDVLDGYSSATADSYSGVNSPVVAT